ncbi:hypothetical protein DUP77_16750 [Salmonella enterica subsp. houtenae]|nr:hypothetical protein [Salmonella enterica subsp. houtenae]EHY70891.1 hypothetical protein SEHO0A_01963 [Salmonella enterica subsp. houtenae str. ATCC BAA-1581]MKN58002.1 hypothetical protein [Salmonella enterica subsp. houtenae]
MLALLYLYIRHTSSYLFVGFLRSLSELCKLSGFAASPPACPLIYVGYIMALMRFIPIRIFNN